MNRVLIFGVCGLFLLGIVILGCPKDTIVTFVFELQKAKYAADEKPPYVPAEITLGQILDLPEKDAFGKPIRYAKASSVLVVFGGCDAQNSHIDFSKLPSKPGMLRMIIFNQLPEGAMLIGDDGPPDLRIVADPDSKFHSSFGVKLLPCYYILDNRGELFSMEAMSLRGMN